MRMWRVSATYAPAARLVPKQVVQHEYGGRTTTTISYEPEIPPGPIGQTWNWLVRAPDRETSCEIVKKAYCLHGLTDRFVWVSFDAGDAETVEK